MTLRDITHYIDLINRDKFNVYKTVMLGSAAHEFRNPLSSIISMLSILDQGVSEAYKYYLKIA